MDNRFAALSDKGGSERRRQILQVAAHLFARKGYAGTSMRDIGEAAGVLGGSLYHHVRSKDELFVELHNAALDHAEMLIGDAVSREEDAWARLTAACIALLEIQLAPDSLTTPLMNDFREVPESVRARLVHRRDQFEAIFRNLVTTLPLPRELDRSIYRNLLLAQLNSVSSWYRQGGLTPGQIAQQIIAIFRHDAG